jgi:hypothetical protein
LLVAFEEQEKLSSVSPPSPACPSRRSVEPLHPQVYQVHYQSGTSHGRLEELGCSSSLRFVSIEEHREKTWSRCRRIAMGTYDRMALEALNFKGLGYMIEERMRNAEEIFTHALSRARICLGDIDGLTLALVANLAHFHSAELQLTEAEAYAREVINTYKTYYPPSVSPWRFKYTLVEVLDKRQQHNQAEDFLRKTETDLNATLGPLHLDTLIVRQAITSQLRKLGKYRGIIILSRNFGGTPTHSRVRKYEDFGD